MGYSYSSIAGYVSGITQAQYKEGLKANAMAVKMFAWWCRSIFAKHKSEGAHVCNTTGCQVYSPSVTVSSEVSTAVNDICTVGVRTDTGWILFAQYLGTGNWSSANSSHTGVFIIKKGPTI